ncbi:MULTISPECIES: MFS transporter [unclassified Rhizobium]|uniref:MFS transporter n=1 Tax=unclassified Rhizobium TaxID=2613769 RepID=UPI00137478FF|nr:MULTISPECIES: MFS transporter [unclassified Rhizobium]
MTIRRNSSALHLFLPLLLFGMAQSMLGASTPLLKAALSPSDFIISAHFFVYAAGRIISGPVASTLRDRGSTRSAPALEGWAAAGLGSAMCGLFSLQSLGVTLGSAFLIGLFAGSLHVLIQIRINQESSESSSSKFAAAYLWVSIGVFLFPFILGLILSKDWTSLSSLIMPLALVGATIVFFLLGKYKINTTEHSPLIAKSDRLSSLGWKLLCLVAVNSCFEWAFGFWGSYYAQSRFGFTTSTSLSIMSAYLLMTIVGRLLNIFVLKVLRPIVAYRIYAVTSMIVLVTIFMAPSPALFTLLFPVIGFFAGCLFPTNLALANAYIQKEFSAFIARSTVVGGLALLIFPVTLGSLAQMTSIELSFAAVSITAMLIVIGILFSLKAQERRLDASE